MSRRTLSHFESVVHIVGAGITGLVTALELADLGLKPILSDASGEIFGRARTVEFQEQVVNPGPSWLHDDELLNWMTARYTMPDKAQYDIKGIFKNYAGSFFRDTSQNALTIMPDGIHAGNDLVEEIHNRLLSRWMELSVDGRDRSLASVAACDEQAMRFAHFMARNWFGLESADKCSAKEYFGDESVPGGFVPHDGMNEFLMPMGRELEDLGIPVYRSTINVINNVNGGYKLTGTNNYEFMANSVLLTPPIVPLQRIKFDKPLRGTPEIASYLDDVVPTHLTKIIPVFRPSFFEQTDAGAIKPNTHIRGLSAEQPFFAFARPLGASSIILFAAGSEAVRVERYKPEKVRDMLRHAFGYLSMLHGFEEYMVGDPFVTKHATIPRFGESFSALRIDGKRPDKVLEHTPGLFIANADTAALDEGAATMTGAYRMGMKAAPKIMRYLDNSQPK